MTVTSPCGIDPVEDGRLPNLYPGISKSLEGARKRFLMLGLGRQSVAMLLMAERGLIGPKPDAAIVADMCPPERGWAREMLRTLQSPNFPLSIPIITHSSGNLEGDFEDATLGITNRFSQPPMFLKNEFGERGRLTRRCTRDFKVTPNIAEIKRLLGFEKGARMPREPIAEQWLGFSIEEIGRVAPNKESWLVARTPLVEIGWTTAQCERWLFQEYGLRVRHSGCYFCPNSGDGVWAAMKRDDPPEFEKACQMDEAARHGIPGIDNEAYLHSSLEPLRSIDFDQRIADQRGRLLDWQIDGAACDSGACGT